MPTREEISEIYDNFLANLNEKFVFNGFVFGFSMSMLLCLIIVYFIKIPEIVIIIFALFTSIFFGFLPTDISQLMNFLDIPFSIAIAFLYLRLCMSLSRTILNYTSLQETSVKAIIIGISFISLCLAIFVIYYSFIENNVLVVGVYILNAVTILLTFILNSGIISDAFLVVAYSITFFSYSEEYSTLFSVLRFFFLIFSVGSLLKVFETARLESYFLIFPLKKRRVRILLILAIASYLYVSPCLMWHHGYERCLFQAVVTPLLYIILSIYENFATNDPNFYGYN